MHGFNRKSFIMPSVISLMVFFFSSALDAAVIKYYSYFEPGSKIFSHELGLNDISKQSHYKVWYKDSGEFQQMEYRFLRDRYQSSTLFNAQFLPVEEKVYQDSEMIQKKFFNANGALSQIDYWNEGQIRAQLFRYYQVNGQLIQEIYRLHPNYKLNGMLFEAEKQWIWKYDDLERKQQIEIYLPDVKSGRMALQSKHVFEYLINSYFAYIRNDYTAEGQIRQRWFFNKDNTLTKMEEMEPGTNQKTIYKYNAHGRVQLIETYSPTGAMIDSREAEELNILDRENYQTFFDPQPSQLIYPR